MPERRRDDTTIPMVVFPGFLYGGARRIWPAQSNRNARRTVYRVSPKLELSYIDTKEKYQDARAIVRQRRESRAADDDGDYRLIFARQQGEAEKLLSTPRDERVIGED
jgi:hypothetical protein